jgi:hypothetical protein
MKKLLGRITVEKIIIALFLAEIAIIIIPTIRILSIELSQNSSTINALFTNLFIIVLGTIFCTITIVVFLIFKKNYYVRKLKESEDQYLNDTTELAQLHEINKAEYLEKIRRLQEQNIAISASLYKVQTERLNLSSAYTSLAFKYNQLLKKVNSEKS